MNLHRRTRPGKAPLVVAVTAVLLCVLGTGLTFARAERSRPAPLRIAVTPAKRIVDASDTAQFRVRIDQGDDRPVTLSVRGVNLTRTRAFVKPRTTRQQWATITVVTSGAPSGGHRLRVMATSGGRHTSALVKLGVRAPSVTGEPAPIAAVIGPVGEPSIVAPVDQVEPVPQAADQPIGFTIRGDLPRPLRPGLSDPLDLALTNPRSVAIVISGLSVELAGISAPRAQPERPCTPADFAVAQFSGLYGFTLDPGSTATLSELGFPAERWPVVTMLDRSVDQNGCQGASLDFAFTGNAAVDA